MDANQDDRVGLDEFLSCRSRQFQAMDTDKNSIVVLTEYTAYKSVDDYDSND